MKKKSMNGAPEASSLSPAIDTPAPYVTGALVKVGQLAAEALRGRARWGWAPNLLLWAALVAGSLCGAVAYHWINLAAIWFAAASALALSAILAATIHL
jgi:uncharacterized membrane protein YoaK (UPF0700 family)